MISKKTGVVLWNRAINNRWHEEQRQTVIDAIGHTWVCHWPERKTCWKG